MTPEAAFGLGVSGAELAALAGIAAIGGFMRGFAGFATTLFMVPLFSLILEPAPAVLIGLALDAVATIPLVPNAARQANWRSVLPVLLGGIVVIPFGAWLLMTIPVPVMRAVIAAVVIACALLMLSGWTYRGRKSPVLSFLVGGFAGTMGTATGIGGPPVAVYFLFPHLDLGRGDRDCRLVRPRRSRRHRVAAARHVRLRLGRQPHFRSRL
jgi:uncharacterized membrane protein YfcA